MRATLRSVFVASLSLTACQAAAPLGSSPVDVQAQKWVPADAAPPPSGGGPVSSEPPKASVDAAPTVVVVEDAGAAQPDVMRADVGEPITCASLAEGGAPDSLKDFQWRYVVPTMGPYNAPYDSVVIDNGCVMTYQHVIMSPMPKTDERSVTMSAADCAAARGWVTNARFLHVLRTGEGCPYGAGNPDDVFDLTLTDEGRVARKTYLCPEPTLDAVRACLRPLVARLFPN